MLLTPVPVIKGMRTKWQIKADETDLNCECICYSKDSDIKDKSLSVYVSDITYNISVTKRIWRKMRKGREVNDLVFLLLSLGNDSIAVKNCTVCGT